MKIAKVEEKAQRWQDLTNTYSSVTDKLGTKIDASILELVIALNALGFRTTGSCEGHFEGSASPYVDIIISSPSERKKEALNTLIDAQKQEYRLPIEEAHSLLAKANRHFEEINQQYHLPVRKRILEYLNLFYNNRKTSSYDIGLTLHNRVVHGFVEEIRLENLGADIIILEAAAERTQKLTTYQREMQAFAQFLKDFYLEREAKR